MPRIPIKLIRQKRKPFHVCMTRELARRLGAFAPGIGLWGQINRDASDIPIIIVIPIKRIGDDEELVVPDGSSILVWPLRSDDEGDIKRKDKKAA